MGRFWGTVKNNTGGLSGQYMVFDNSYLVSHSADVDSNSPPGTPLELTPPFVVIGGIWSFWKSAGEFSSTYGRPLCDEQITADGERCSIFEGGHIHCNDEGLAEEYAKSSSFLCKLILYDAH